ncbi:MAG: hypothetical protein RBS47_10450 [Hydrogenophaga sp.]|nr:hypothetical protein [Hydrogenophaga sp.]
MALLAALEHFNQEGHPPTMRELAHRARVSLKDTRNSLNGLVRAGHVEIRAFKRVTYRNRPVALYGFPLVLEETAPAAHTLAAAIDTWR